MTIVSSWIEENRHAIACIDALSNQERQQVWLNERRIEREDEEEN